MSEKTTILLRTKLANTEYRLAYRCTNCGTIFQFDIRKGVPTTAMKGICPTCGIKSGTPNIGVFDVIKENQHLDQVERHYFR